MHTAITNSEIIDTKYLVKLREDCSKEKVEVKKRAIYVRVSTKEQALTGYGVDAQITNITNRLLAENIDVSSVQIYADDGYSAKSLNRPAMQRLLKDVLDGKINEIIIYKLDRIARNVIDTYELLQFFLNQQCELKAIVDNLDIHSANGRLLVGVLAIIAQWEREVIRERTIDAIEEMLIQGKWPFGQVPFGYVRNENDYLQEKVREGEYIRYCIELAISGDTMKEIEYKAPIEFPEFQKKSESIKNMLLRTINYGEYEYGGKIYRFPGITTKAKYDKVVKMVNKRYKETDPSKYYFGNKIKDVCGNICERKSTSKKLKSGIKKYYYYVCQECKQRISQERLVEASLGRIAMHAYGLNEVKKEQNIKRRLKTLDDKIKEAYRMYIGNKIDGKVYGSLINKIDKEREKLLHKLDIRSMGEYVDTEKWNEMSDGDRKQYIEEYVKEIIVDVSLNTIISIEFME